MGNREQNIRRIIDMEDRISRCQRCKSSIRCIRKASLGKGDLDPEVVVVFEADSNFTQDLNQIINFRNSIKELLKKDKIYHTFMVRCQPKTCIHHENAGWYGETKFLDKDHKCILTGKLCEGAFIRPTNEEVISCLPFLLEEIEILKPSHVILLGERATFYVLRAYGIFDEIKTYHRYYNGKKAFISLDYEDKLDERKYLEALKEE